MKLNEEAVRKGAQTDLDDLGIAKNAREEKLKKQHDEMAKLYRQHVLKEQPTLQIQGLGGGSGSGRKKEEPQPVLHKPTV